ncbi:unnamed protein product [Paramecium primaurelia]|uniref:Uncharacterized protein n=1 Tax=Paramecium primaurelia TaxID=5886 RepID=A0A8S1LIK0_PARPR|nr:unnamed protein product [Paramecium primaurelia]
MLNLQYPSKIQRYQIHSKGKVLITLRYTDLGPDDFDLIQEQSKTKLVNKSKVHELLLGTDNPIKFVMIQRSKGCCCFTF